MYTIENLRYLIKVVDALTRMISFTVPQKSVKKAYNFVVNDITTNGIDKGHNIAKGYRRHNAHIYVAQKYSKEIKFKTLNLLYSRALEQALEKEDLLIVHILNNKRPESEFSYDDDFSFSLTVEICPNDDSIFSFKKDDFLLEKIILNKELYKKHEVEQFIKKAFFLDKKFKKTDHNAEKLNSTSDESTAISKDSNSVTAGSGAQDQESPEPSTDSLETKSLEAESDLESELEFDEEYLKYKSEFYEMRYGSIKEQLDKLLLDNYDREQVRFINEQLEDKYFSKLDFDVPAGFLDYVSKIRLNSNELEPNKDLYYCRKLCAAIRLFDEYKLQVDQAVVDNYTRYFVDIFVKQNVLDQQLCYDLAVNNAVWSYKLNAIVAHFASTCKTKEIEAGSYDEYKTLMGKYSIEDNAPNTNGDNVDRIDRDSEETTEASGENGENGENESTAEEPKDKS